MKIPDFWPDWCCRPLWRNPWCMLDSVHHWVVWILDGDKNLPGCDWICDKHEHAITGER